MGHVFALCGPSGAGKTSLLERLASAPIEGLRFLTRTTSRAPRPGERGGLEYTFYSRTGFLQKVFANDFVQVEHYGDDIFGIEAAPIQDAVSSPEDAVIMAGVYGATRLKDVFAKNVSILYVYPGPRQELMSPDTLAGSAPSIEELRRRLHQKIRSNVLNVADADANEYVEQRIASNLLEVAFINGRIRAGETVNVLENGRDRLDAAIEAFARLRASATGTKSSYSRLNQCFVLMPFRDDLLPVYDDHLAPTARRAGLDCLRADRIFSNRPIMEDVLEAVHRARIVIADLTTGNPNVFYETGICHALGKEVILITQDADVPFDLKHIRHIRYQYTPRGIKRFEEELFATLTSILHS